MKKYKTIRLLAAALLLAAILPAAAPAAEGETFTVSYGKGYYFENPLTARRQPVFSPAASLRRQQWHPAAA